MGAPLGGGTAIMRTRLTTTAFTLATLTTVGLGPATEAFGGGGPENLLLVINPSDPVSMRVGNYYKAARNVPDQNVLYIDPSASDYQAFTDTNLQGFLGTLTNRVIADHIDYVLVMPGAPFFIPASGYVTDGCSPVNRFATPTGFSLAYLADDILAGVQVSEPNRFSTISREARAFDSNTMWFGGEPSNDPDAQRYYIGFMLGYTGERGNTEQEILDLIDRSVAVDGTFPAGTFYFLETNDNTRSDPRDGAYQQTADYIINLGGLAEVRCCSNIPTGADDCLGIMTGASSPTIDGGVFTVLPGAFCDHLTSFAGRFDTSSQVKMSEWIRKGASGTAGTVEEPCNYPGKFPRSHMHAYYFQGSTLGEATFRSMSYAPFQPLLYGDPLTRPFAHIPSVSVDDAPGGAVSGIVTLTPTATTSHPSALIDRHDLLVDGVTWGTIEDGAAFNLDTTRLSDGFHELRVVSYDDTLVATVGRWIGTLEVDNDGLAATATADVPSGDLSTAFEVSVTATGGGSVAEARLIHAGRVVAAGPDLLQPLVVHGRMLGPGDAELKTEVEFADGRTVNATGVTITVADSDGTPIGAPPIAFGYTRNVNAGEAFVLELPGTLDDASLTPTYTVITAPTQSSIVSTNDGPYRIIVPDANASGSDQLTFRLNDGTTDSNTATITLVYDECAGAPMSLSVSALNSGEIGTVTVTCAFPDEPTYLAYSLVGEGATFIPFLNVTLDLRNPRQAGSAEQSDLNGTAVWSLPVPDVRRATLVWMQAAQRSAKTGVVLTQINP